MMGRAVSALCLLTPLTAAAEPITKTFAASPKDLPDDFQGLAVAIALMGLCGVAFVLTRANAVRRTFATSRRLVPVEQALLAVVARAQRRRSMVFASACMLSMLAISSLPLDLGARTLLMATPMLLLATTLFGLTRLQQLIEPDGELRVLAHGDYLFAARGRKLVGWVAAPPRLIARASHLPVATVRS